MPGGFREVPVGGVGCDAVGNNSCRGWRNLVWVWVHILALCLQMLVVRLVQNPNRTLFNLRPPDEELQGVGQINWLGLK